jgi:hypothetical protein
VRGSIHFIEVASEVHSGFMEKFIMEEQDILEVPMLLSMHCVSHHQASIKLLAALT